MTVEPGVAFATVLHDPGGRLAGRIEELLPAAMRLFGGTAVTASSAAAEGSIRLVADAGATFERDTSPLGLEWIGERRRKSVALALESFSSPHVLYADLDHVLRWAHRRRVGLEQALDEVRRHDFTVVGRRPETFAALPGTLRETESLVNRVFATMSGREWDVMTGVRGFSRRGAQVITSECEERSIGNDVAWPLHAIAAGLDASYVEGDGLDYEDKDQFTSPIERDEWVRRLEASPRAWAARMEINILQFRAMLPYLDAPSRPR